jgi:hypothetical protein
MTGPLWGYPPLFHYTCEHGRRALGDLGRVAPLRVHSPGAAVELTRRHLGVLSVMCWFTDLDEPLREVLGLTSHALQCDRTAYRYRVTDPRGIDRWLASPLRRRCSRDILRNLELGGAGLPAHWWVAVDPVPVVFDPIRKGDTNELRA